jgi:hypothetical protein
MSEQAAKCRQLLRAMETPPIAGGGGTGGWNQQTRGGVKQKEKISPWELGSGRVSLATKCMTVVRPGGSFRAFGNQTEI